MAPDDDPAFLAELDRRRREAERRRKKAGGTASKPEGEQQGDGDAGTDDAGPSKPGQTDEPRDPDAHERGPGDAGGHERGGPRDGDGKGRRGPLGPTGN